MDITMIEVKNVVKKFDGFAALDGATLTVPSGSVYGLVGPNGAGKSTLIRHLTGIYRQDAGEIRVSGEPVWENPALKAKIAAIPDDWYYFLQSSVVDMMRFYRGFYPRFSMERYGKLKEVFAIDEKKTIRHLSKGMQKQVAFWLTMCCLPEYLILDEPVDGLDPVMRRQVWSLIMSDVSEHGTTVLVSSHNLRELEDVCDHVGIMDHGRVLLERSLAQLQDNMVKLQVVFPDGVQDVPADLPVLHASKIGRIHTLIMRMNAEEAARRLEQYQPMLVDAVPLTLEEIFIYELGGADYAVKDIVL
jgi:ABC-2 type transport system ATP-binding protein